MKPLPRRWVVANWWSVDLPWWCLLCLRCGEESATAVVVDFVHHERVLAWFVRSMPCGCGLRR